MKNVVTWSSKDDVVVIVVHVEWQKDHVEGRTLLLWVLKYLSPRITLIGYLRGPRTNEITFIWVTPFEAGAD